MRFQILAFIVSLFSHAVALPASSLHDLFTHLDVPVPSELDPSLFNLTLAHNHRDVPSKRATNLSYLLYNIKWTVGTKATGRTSSSAARC